MSEEERFRSALNIVGAYLRKHHPDTAVFFIDHLGYKGDGSDDDRMHLYDVFGFEIEFSTKDDENE